MSSILYVNMNLWPEDAWILLQTRLRDFTIKEFLRAKGHFQDSELATISDIRQFKLCFKRYKSCHIVCNDPEQHWFTPSDEYRLLIRDKNICCNLKRLLDFDGNPRGLVETLCGRQFQCLIKEALNAELRNGSIPIEQSSCFPIFRKVYEFCTCRKRHKSCKVLVADVVKNEIDPTNYEYNLYCVLKNIWLNFSLHYVPHFDESPNKIEPFRRYLQQKVTECDVLVLVHTPFLYTPAPSARRDLILEMYHSKMPIISIILDRSCLQMPHSHPVNRCTSLQFLLTNEPLTVEEEPNGMTNGSPSEVVANEHLENAENPSQENGESSLTNNLEMASLIKGQNLCDNGKQNQINMESILLSILSRYNNSMINEVYLNNIAPV